MKTPTNLQIEAEEYGAKVFWNDERRCYTVRVNRDGEIQSHVHPTLPNPSARGQISIDLSRKTNTNLLSAIQTLATPERVRAVMVERKRRLEAEEAEQWAAKRIHALRNAVQSIIGASADDLAAALVDTDPVLAAAVTKLREAGQ